MAELIVFPPIIDEYIPAFVGNSVEFTIKPSVANKLDDYASFEVLVTEMNTNQPIAAAIAKSENLYKLNITGTLVQDTFYKIQVRGTNPVTEWSTPAVTKWLGESDFISIISTSFPTAIAVDTANSNELIASYEITLLKDTETIETQKLLADSANSKNITYTPATLLTAGDYKVKVTYITENLYAQTVESEIITIEDSNSSQAFVEFNIYNNSDYGCLEVGFTIQSHINAPLTLWRQQLTSLKPIWEKVLTLANSDFTAGSVWHWRDYTVENGHAYKYAMSYVNGGLYTYYLPEEAIVADFEDIFLITKEKVLKIKYNPSVTNWKIVVQENITNTLGSQYPFVRRSGKVKYRQFSLGGLISCRDDELQVTNLDLHPFITEDDMYGAGRDTIAAYNNLSGVTYATDRIKEKFYREAVSAFLEDGEVKLFKSPTEGNVLVHLGSVSFTPNEQLGRLLHSFTAQATEVAPCTMASYIKYELFNATTVVNTYIPVAAADDTLFHYVNDEVIPVLVETVKEDGTVVYVMDSTGVI